MRSGSDAVTTCRQQIRSASHASAVCKISAAKLLHPPLSRTASSRSISLTVKKAEGPMRPLFGGRFASGPLKVCFVYLSRRAIERGDCINRVEARLSDLDWQMVRAAQGRDKAITTDMTGRTPGAPLRGHIGVPKHRHNRMSQASLASSRCRIV